MGGLDTSSTLILEKRRFKALRRNSSGKLINLEENLSYIIGKFMYFSNSFNGREFADLKITSGNLLEAFSKSLAKTKSFHSKVDLDEIDIKVKTKTYNDFYKKLHKSLYNYFEKFKRVVDGMGTAGNKASFEESKVERLKKIDDLIFKLQIVIHDLLVKIGRSQDVGDDVTKNIDMYMQLVLDAIVDYKRDKRAVYSILDKSTITSIRLLDKFINQLSAPEKIPFGLFR